MMNKRFILFVAVISVMFSGVAVRADGVPYFVEAGGVVSMEAENYSTNNGYVFSNAPTVVSPDHGVMDASNFSGTGYMSTNRTGVQMDYVIEFTTTGTYYITLRSLAGGHYENGFCAKFDGNFVVGYCDTRGGHGINTAKWARWAWVSRAQYPTEPLLRGCVMINVGTPGKHTFSILQRESLAWLDKIVLRLTSFCQQDYLCQGCFGETEGPPESERVTDRTTCTGDTPVIQNVTFSAGDVYTCTAATSITLGPGVTIESGATVDLTAPLVKGVDGVTVKEGANLTITTP